MPPSRFSRSKPDIDAQETHSKRGLVRNILLALLFVLFLPLVVLGTVTFFRSHDFLSRQITSQAEHILQNEAVRLVQFVSLREEFVDRLVTDELFKEHLLTLATDPKDSSRITGAQAFLLSSFQAGSRLGAQNYLDEMLILSTDGELLLSTNVEWAKLAFGPLPGLDPGIQELTGSNRSIFVFIPAETGGDASLTLLVSRSFIDEQGTPVATLIASTPAGPSFQGLNDSLALLPGASGFFFNRVGQLIHVTDQGRFSRVEHPGISAALSPLVEQSSTQISFTANFQDGSPALAFARWFPELKIGILLAMPKRAVLAQNALFDPLNLLPIAFAFILAGGVLYVASRRLINPVQNLSEAVTRSTHDNLSGQAQVKHADEMEIALVHQVTQAVTQARSELEFIQNLADVLIKFPLLSAFLSLEVDEITILFATNPATGRVEKNLPGFEILGDNTIKLLVENRAVLIEDISQAIDYKDLLSYFLQQGWKSAGLVSILTNGKLSKILAIGTRDQSQIIPTSDQSYPVLSAIISFALDKLMMLNTLQQRLEELQILASFSQSISAETDLNNLYHELHVQVIQTFGPDLEFGVGMYNRKKNMIEFPYYFEKGEPITIPPFPLGSGLTSMLLQSRQPILLPDLQSIQRHSGIQIGEPAKSWMGIPLIFAGETIGAIVVQDLENENRFTLEDLNMLATLAPHIATTVRNTQLYTETQQALHAYDQEHFLLNTLLDNMPEGITFKDTDGRHIRASSSVAQPLNVAPDELIGKTNRDFMDEDAAHLVHLHEQSVLNSGSPEIGMIDPVIVDGETKAWTHTSRIPIHLPTGEPYGLLIIQRDITELKQAEALAQQRANQVTIAAEIARDATGSLEVKTLLQKAVTLINERFGFYQASIFLIDPDDEYAVLRESSGPAGQQMLQAGHRLAVGSQSIVGQVSESGKALIVNDVTQSPTYFPNPLLPDTRSELAIPLIVGERILGALDVQSTQVNAFKDEDVSVLQILADQLAVAVVNGELFARAQELLGKHRLLRQISIAASSSTDLQETLTNVVHGLFTARVGERIAILMLNSDGNLQVQASAGYEGARYLEPRIALGQGITGQAAIEKRPIRVDNTLSDPRYINIDPGVRSELAIPILFKEELLGVLNLASVHIAGFDENDLEILGALGNNLGAVITNIRLIEQIRRQIIRERQLFDVTSKIRHSVDMEAILETSTKEICRVLGARRAKIQITAGTSPPDPTVRGEKTSPNSKIKPRNGRAAGRSD